MKKVRRRQPPTSRQVERPATRSGSAKNAATVHPSFSFARRDLWLGVGLAALIVLVYAPVRHYGFVDLDDPQYVSENPFVANGLTWSGVKWAFTSVHASYWLPVI